MTQQRSIKKACSLNGRGLHSGEDVKITLLPASANSGIVFVRTDLPGQPRIKVGNDTLALEGISRCSMIQEGDAKVFTLEHLMAALAGLEIDNITIEIDGEEVPGMDGSALPFAQALLDAGIDTLDQPKKYLDLKESITVEHQGARITIEPAATLSIEYHLDYPLPLLKQQVQFDITPDVFMKDIAPARTFCLKEEAAYLKSQGLGKGATTQNTLIVDDSGPEENTFRFPDECGRHKLLDCLGDLYLLGLPLKGRVRAYKSGHALNNKLVHHIITQCRASIKS